MPYLIVNDRKTPWHYYCGQGFTIERETTVEESAAQRLTLSEANQVMYHHPDQAYLYQAGWRIVPVDH